MTTNFIGSLKSSPFLGALAMFLNDSAVPVPQCAAGRRRPWGWALRCVEDQAPSLNFFSTRDVQWHQASQEARRFWDWDSCWERNGSTAFKCLCCSRSLMLPRTYLAQQHWSGCSQSFPFVCSWSKLYLHRHYSCFGRRAWSRGCPSCWKQVGADLISANWHRAWCGWK